MTDLINAFRIVVCLYLRFQFINYYLLFFLTLSYLFLAFNGNIVNINISSLLILPSLDTILTFSINLLLLLRKLNLVH